MIFMKLTEFLMISSDIFTAVIEIGMNTDVIYLFNWFNFYICIDIGIYIYLIINIILI